MTDNEEHVERIAYAIMGALPPSVHDRVRVCDLFKAARAAIAAGVDTSRPPKAVEAIEVPLNWWVELGPRSHIDDIIRHVGSEDIDVVARAGRMSIRSAPNVGPGAIKKLETVLHKYGRALRP